MTIFSMACGGGAPQSKASPSPATFTISGIVSGLSGTGLVLQMNGSNNLAVSADGSFIFAGAIAGGSTYNVTVMTQPSSPSQTCTITNGSGTANANVTSVQVSCTMGTTYTIGGSVSGLSGSGLVLQDNTSDNLTITGNGSFTFGTGVQAGGGYNVTVKTQPSNPAQACSIANASGTANANITNIGVTCNTATYTIGGTLSGLASGTIVLQDNGGDDLSVSANGLFTFGNPIAAGSGYSVTVKTQPTGESCSVSKGSGTADANVTNVAVTCSAITYTIGGTLSGLSSGSVVLQDNGGDDLSLIANGAFTFATKIAAGSGYDVTVKTQPSGISCTVANGNGTANSNVANVQIACATSSGNAIKQSFFGASFNFFTIWPPTDGLGHVATLGSVRLWDDMVKWGQINSGPGVYDWSLLDRWVSMAQEQNLEILYTFGDTPQFAGTIPKGSVHCLEPSDYSCSPPNDVNSDGTGTDADFSNFVTAVVSRYKGRISYYELWNEPDCSCYFAGTDAQLVRMGKDASAIIHSLDPDAQVLSPSYHVWTLSNFFDPYIQAGGAATFDIVNFHMRGNGTLNEQPESFTGTYASIVSDLKKNKLNNLPLWDSEHGIKSIENITDPDELAGYAARELVLRAGIGLPRQFVYSWDDNPPVGLQGNEGGTAYDTVAGWLLGHSISPCVGNGSVYTCAVDDGQIVWDTAQSCSNGVCTTSEYTYPPSYAWKTDLSGIRTALTGTTVPIGYKPSFLQAQ